MFGCLPRLLVDMVGGCFCVLEKDLNNIWDCDKEDLFALRRVATATCVIIAGYFGDLQGEQFPKID